MNFIILQIIKNLKSRKGVIYSIILVKFLEYVISIIIKAEKVGFNKMIKIIYYVLTVFNLLLALIMIVNFSDIDFSLTIFGHMLDVFKILIPVMILDMITEYYVDLGLFFKKILKRFINWIYTTDVKVEPKKVINRKRVKEIIDPFSTPIKAADIESYDYRDYYKGIEEYEASQRIGWKTVAFFTFLAVGVSYYMYPELYQAVYYAIKDRLFGDTPRGGGGAAGAVTTGNTRVGDSTNVSTGTWSVGTSGNAPSGSTTSVSNVVPKTTGKVLSLQEYLNSKASSSVSYAEYYTNATNAIKNQANVSPGVSTIETNAPSSSPLGPGSVVINKESIMSGILSTPITPDTSIQDLKIIVRDIMFSDLSTTEKNSLISSLYNSAVSPSTCNTATQALSRVGFFKGDIQNIITGITENNPSLQPDTISFNNYIDPLNDFPPFDPSSFPYNNPTYHPNIVTIDSSTLPSSGSVPPGSSTGSITPRSSTGSITPTNTPKPGTGLDFMRGSKLQGLFSKPVSPDVTSKGVSAITPGYNPMVHLPKTTKEDLVRLMEKLNNRK